MIYLIVTIIVCGVFYYLFSKNKNRPPLGFIKFKAHIYLEDYNRLLDKGGYNDEKDMLIDALSILEWSLNRAVLGEHIFSGNEYAEYPQEYSWELLNTLRSSYKPISHLEKCFLMEIPPENPTS